MQCGRANVTVRGPCGTHNFLPRPFSAGTYVWLGHLTYGLREWTGQSVKQLLLKWHFFPNKEKKKNKQKFCFFPSPYWIFHANFVLKTMALNSFLKEHHGSPSKFEIQIPGSHPISAALKSQREDEGGETEVCMFTKLLFVSRYFENQCFRAFFFNYRNHIWVLRASHIKLGIFIVR